MTVERFEQHNPSEPHETYGEARIEIVGEMLRRYKLYDNGDLSGLFKKFNEEEVNDEI